MKKGEIVNGYEIITRPSNTNAGKCVWAFARKDGSDFFIKEYLDPKRPRPDSMGSVADKKRRLAECRRFERHHEKLSRLLRADHRRAGNLVLTKDFFAEGTRYYKVTDRIRPKETNPADLPPQYRNILLHTLCESVALLHDCKIVHGDLKPENILFHSPERSDLCVAKLIDFDDAYVSGDPPAADVLGGNPYYGAPEWLGYLRGDKGSRAKELTTAVDLFALGLLVHGYLTGAPPAFPAQFESPAAAVLAGEDLQLHPNLPSGWAPLLAAMTRADPTARPGIGDVLSLLASLRPPSRVPRSRVRINLTGQTPAEGAR
ncbi:protein kinase [Amycolatopsis sp. NPDC001319]|uniref:protein kinase domain-containing protein n=1 Tax=unclassified Amycolatopsis TaxID=2618356 RepID=UPI0036A3AA33